MTLHTTSCRHQSASCVGLCCLPTSAGYMEWALHKQEKLTCVGAFRNADEPASREICEGAGCCALAAAARAITPSTDRTVQIQDINQHLISVGRPAGEFSWRQRSQVLLSHPPVDASPLSTAPAADDLLADTAKSGHQICIMPWGSIACRSGVTLCGLRHSRPAILKPQLYS